MSYDGSLWLSIIGAVTGPVGMITGIASAIYTRRQAIAAEGPAMPDIEVEMHGWDKAASNWYFVEVITKNRTGKTWDMTTAKVVHPRLAKITSMHSISRYDESGSYATRPRSELDLSSISNTAKATTCVRAAGSLSHDGRQSDVMRETFFVYLPSSGHIDFISIVFSLEDRAAIARHKKMELRKRLTPSAPKPT